jgi:hypothetical protein
MDELVVWHYNDESKVVAESKISNVKPFSDKLHDWLLIMMKANK